MRLQCSPKLPSSRDEDVWIAIFQLFGELLHYIQITYLPICYDPQLFATNLMIGNFTSLELEAQRVKYFLIFVVGHCKIYFLSTTPHHS